MTIFLILPLLVINFLMTLSALLYILFNGQFSSEHLLKLLNAVFSLYQQAAILCRKFKQIVHSVLHNIECVLFALMNNKMPYNRLIKLFHVLPMYLLLQLQCFVFKHNGFVFIMLFNAFFNNLNYLHLHLKCTCHNVITPKSIESIYLVIYKRGV